MAARTYIPGLLLATKAVLAFVKKYRVKIEEGLGPTGTALLDALILAAEALETFLLTAAYPASDALQENP